MKQYSINWENDEIVSIEVDGESYHSVADIPDPDDRAWVTTLIDQHYLSMAETDFDKEFDKEFRQIEKGSKRVTQFILGIFLTIVLLSFTICIISTVSINRRLARETSAPGQVVDLATHTNLDGLLFYYPVVEFELPDGTQQIVKLTTGSSNPQYVYGETVTILYEVEHPSTARIASNESTLLVWTLPTVTGLLGLAFLIATIFVVWFTRPKSKE